MYYWTGHGSKSFFRKDTCTSWGNFDSETLPTEVNSNIKRKPVYGCIAVHVDDVAIFGENALLEWLTEKIKARFDTKEFKENQFQYLGMQITQTEDLSITMQTKEYEKEIELVEIDCDRELQVNEPLTVVEVKNFRSSLGKLMWIARLTRPDLAFESAAAAQKYADDQNPNAEYIEEDLAWGEVGNADPLIWNESEMTHMPGFGEGLKGKVR